jgi:hypothetical protein
VAKAIGAANGHVSGQVEWMAGGEVERTEIVAVEENPLADPALRIRVKTGGPVRFV